MLTTTEQSVVVNADGDSLDNDIILTDDVNYLVLPVTSDQYKDLLSACINGVFTTFPENPIGVLYPLIKAGKVSICDAIIDCINDPESGVSDVIYDLFGGDSYQSNRSNGQSQNDVDLSSSLNPTCDKDILFGQVTQLVDYLDQLNTDFFEILEVASNTTEFLAEVVGDITFIDESSLDAAISWIAFIQDSISENYAAQVTQSYKDDLACEIFCATQVGCQVTPRILYDIFKNRLSSSVSLEGIIWDTLDFLAGGGWSGSQIADFMFYGQLALRSQLGKYFEKYAYQDIETRLSIYSNDPDPDWMILCPCAGYLITFDDLSSDDWSVTTELREWTTIVNQNLQNNAQGNPIPSCRASFGYDDTFSSLRGIQARVRVDFTTPQDVERVNFEYYFKQPANDVLTREIELYDSDDNLISSVRNGGSTTQETWLDFEWTGTANDVAYIFCYISVFGSSPQFSNTTCQGWIDNIRIDVA